MIIEGTLEKRNADLQIIVNKVTAVPLDKLQAIAKRDGLWTEGETIDKANRQDVEDFEVAKAEEVMHVDDKKVKPVIDTVASGPTNPEDPKPKDDTYTILVNREVGKEFFLLLKLLFERHPGKQKVQLQIGDRLIPVPMGVELTPDVLGEVEGLMK
jgi:hypothetical protein